MVVSRLDESLQKARSGPGGPSSLLLAKDLSRSGQRALRAAGSEDTPF